VTSIKCFWMERTEETVTRPYEHPCSCDSPDCNGTNKGTVTVPMYRRTDTGELLELRDAPVGAMWNAEWWNDIPAYTGADGISLVVRTPAWDWMVDGRASNCGLPNDHVHKCWIRHGDPRTGNIHVDKDGVTCSAGAGSILQGSYHGFLHNGCLVQC
jgi:hypothetical protein